MKKTFIFLTMLALSLPAIGKVGLFYDSACQACVEAKEFIISKGLDIEILLISSKSNKKLTGGDDEQKLINNSVLLHKISRKNGIELIQTPLLFDLDTESAIIPLNSGDIMMFIESNNKLD